MSTFDKNRCEQSEVTCAYAAAGAAGERGCRGRSPYRLVPGLPARVGEPAPGGRSVRLLAHRRAASDDIAAGAPCASYRRGDREAAGAAAGAAVVRAGMGTGRARDRMQAARDRHGTAPGQHAGAPRARRELPGAYPCRRRRAASPRRRAVDRRAQARSRATTTTVRLERATSASGARPAAPASSSPAPRISFAEAPRARALGPRSHAPRLRTFLSPPHLGPIQKLAFDVLGVCKPRIPQSVQSLRTGPRLTCAYALQVLPASEVAAAEAHIASCPDCQRELESLRPVVDRFVSWPTDVLRPTTSLQARLALRIAEETGKQPVLPPAPRWSEPEWEQVAPGIECKLLATDTERHRVSMLVRLAPGAQLPRAYACGRRRAASPRRRAVDRRAQALPGRLQLRCAWSAATSASGARPAAPAFSSPAPWTSAE